jgi:hypothetical protein
MDDITAWQYVNDDDLWIFDKSILARRLGYISGPSGVPVPTPNSYIVRPCINLQGMGIGAQFLNIESDTSHLPAGHFWCEVFSGRHISVDYKYGNQILTVEGFREPNSPLWRFSKWQKTNDYLPVPDQLKFLTNKYETINIEYIDGKVIEVHLRHNPDFIYGNSIAIPVWEDQEDAAYKDLRFVEARDYKRLGFYID